MASSGLLGEDAGGLVSGVWGCRVRGCYTDTAQLWQLLCGTSVRGQPRVTRCSFWRCPPRALLSRPLSPVPPSAAEPLISLLAPAPCGSPRGL